MHVQQMIFGSAPSLSIPLEDVAEMVSNLLSALRMNGQICGREWPIYQDQRSLVATVMTPEQGSLFERFNNPYVRTALGKLKDQRISVEIFYRGPDAYGNEICTCNTPSNYVLFTHYLSLESPISCLDCFGTVPLYRLPAGPEGEYYRLICWQSDYQACDSLQMNCATLERSTTAQISLIDSNLNKTGIALCREMSESTGKPFFYYLYRGTGTRLGKEKLRPCPGCGENWLLVEPLHSMFDFKCDQCRLLSNISWSARR